MRTLSGWVRAGIAAVVISAIALAAVVWYPVLAQTDVAEQVESGKRVHIRLEWRGDSSIQIPLDKVVDAFICLGSDLQAETLEEAQCLRDALQGMVWDFRVNEIIIEYDGEDWTVTVPIEPTPA